MAEERRTVNIVYLGRRIATDGSKCDTWHVVTDLSGLIGLPTKRLVTNNVLVYKKFRPLGCAPGQVLSVVMEGNSVVPSSVSFQGKWHVAEDLLEWEVRHRDAEEASKQEAAAKKFKEEVGLRDAMKPLRRVYQKLKPAHRSAFLAQMIFELQRPIRPGE